MSADRGHPGALLYSALQENARQMLITPRPRNMTPYLQANPRVQPAHKA
jgi:hypothetical protein